MKKILFFSVGDPGDINTWSNVPYCFCKALENKGIYVVKTNLMPSFWKVVNKIFRYTIAAFIYIFFPKHTYLFVRTRLFRYVADGIIKKVVKNNYDADLCIFTCFDFVNKYSNAPSLIFSDWTIQTLIDDKRRRKPYFFELGKIKLQNQIIKEADFTFVLFPDCAKQLKKQVPEANVFYLRRNVVNTVYQHNIDEHILKTKMQSNEILIIARPFYKVGVKTVVKAIKNYPNLKLNIIGMNNSDLGSVPDNVVCFGYLSKSIENQCNLYYDLILRARCVINPVLPDNLLGGYSSMIECMYFYTPIITAAHKNIMIEFKDEIDDFAIITDFSDNSLSDSLRQITETTHYPDMCVAAHKSVKDYTWSAYVDDMLDIVEGKSDGKYVVENDV